MKTYRKKSGMVMFNILGIRALVILLFACSLSNLCIAANYDVAADFSSTNNPNGAWRYGWSSTLTSFFNLYQNKLNEIGLDGWSHPAIGGDGKSPLVIHNGTANPIANEYELITWQPGQFTLHPGPNGEYSHARWTAPASATIDIDAVFPLIDRDQFTAGTDVHVLRNGISIFDDGIIGFGDTSTFSATISVGAGDIIDFAVGYGIDHGFHNDTTALSATIGIVPEPATLLLLGLGGLVLRRRK
jgi:hypothetical protein